LNVVLGAAKEAEGVFRDASLGLQLRPSQGHRTNACDHG
jgi:hypothetical protein